MFDGTATKRIVGGKAAAFGGVGRERVDWNRPEDKIKAGCTVKIKTVEKRVVQAAHTITLLSGNSYTVPELVEETYKDKLMTVSVSGIGCEVCRTLQLISDRGYVDVSTLVSLCDPDDAPVQTAGNVKGTKQRELHGKRVIGGDNIARVEHREPTSKTYVKPVVDDTPVVVLDTPKYHRFLVHGEPWYRHLDLLMGDRSWTRVRGGERL